MISNFEKSNKYRKKVHNLIPGGCHTYSKGDDQFPELSPAAIKRGKGAYVWDIDDNKFLDCSMGLTSVSLGHAFKPITEEIKKTFDLGVNFQRPSYLELEAAETFLGLIPEHQMIKFSKNGSTATTAAVKLARAYTNRKLIAFPSDHPFYSYDDWFIGHTPCSRGVPSESTHLSVTYLSKDLETLKDLFKKYPGQIAAVITEPERCDEKNVEISLKRISTLCKENKALFIMDEMVSGFKVALPGAITQYGVTPDMATWGKGIANGYSFCALTGKEEVMRLGSILEGQEKVFLISSTHGGETHALTAVIETIKFFKKNNVVGHNHSIGKSIIEKCRLAIESEGLEDYVQVAECHWMVPFSFKNHKKEVDLNFKTYFLQEMIKRGVLFQGVFVPCFSHENEEVELFKNVFHQCLLKYKLALEKESVQDLLVGDPIKPVFRKYN